MTAVTMPCIKIIQSLIVPVSVEKVTTELASLSSPAPSFCNFLAHSCLLHRSNLCVDSLSLSLSLSLQGKESGKEDSASPLPSGIVLTRASAWMRADPSMNFEKWKEAIRQKGDMT